MTPLAVITPAPHWEALAYLRRASALHRRSREGSARQVFGSWTIGWADAQGCAAVMGLYPDGSGAECWLVGDADRARPHLVQIARQARLTLAAWSQDGLAPIRATVRSGWRPGRRLAALTGFVAERHPEGDDAAGPVETFVWRG